MIKIVVVGAGFGGLLTALGLEKQLGRDKNVTITLIDKRDYHLFTPNLYEAATTEEELVSVAQVKNSITLPLREVLSGKNIKFIKGELKEINPETKRLQVDGRELSYDYLVLALGSQSDFFNIPGAKEYALALKDLPDALRLRNQVEFAVQSHRYDVNKKTLRVVVAGGGYTGVELAGELKGLLDYLAWKNQYPREKIELEIIEAAGKLVPGFDDRLSRDAFDRLRDLGIRVRLASRIVSVDRNLIELMGGERVAYDVLVWTTGVKACNCELHAAMPLDKKGRLPVNGLFQVQGLENVFALGDMACVMDKKNRPAPSSAQDAIDQGKYLAYALPLLLKNQKPSKMYEPSDHGFIVNIHGKWAILSHKGLYLAGYLGYLADLYAHFDYYRSIIGCWKAFRMIVFQANIYARND